MINHFKAEFYKLFRSKIMIAILGVCVALVMVSFALGDMTFFGAGDGTESVIGFQAKCYLSSEMPTFQTVARSSLAYTAFFWIVCLVFATIFFTKEYNTGTIKLSVAYGTKRTILYYTKAITILAVSLITYLIFVAAFFVIEIIQSGYIPSASEALTLFGWALACGIVLLAFESICGTSKVITNKPKKMQPGSCCPAQNVPHKILRFHRRMRFSPLPCRACFSAPGLKSAARLH